MPGDDKKTYGLSGADVRKLRTISKRVLGGGAGKRPVPTRRRRVLGGNGTPIVTGLLYETIPAGDVLDVCISLDEWDSAANDYAWVTTGDAADRVAGINGDPDQPIRGSSGVPVRIWGIPRQATLPTDPEDPESDPILKYAVEIFRWNMTQLPGHVTADLQGPYHPAADVAYQLGGGPCTEPA